MSSSSPMPGWWAEALSLEQAGRLTEAEALIDRELPHIGGPIQTAELYFQRLRRLNAAGDRDGAVQAFHRAMDWMISFASNATSGSEGLAYTQQKDDFRRKMVAELGCDPGPRRPT